MWTGVIRNYSDAGLRSPMTLRTVDHAVPVRGRCGTVVAMLAESVRQRTKRTGECRWRPDGGEFRWVRMHVQPHRGIPGGGQCLRL